MLLSKKFLHELMQLCTKIFGAQLSVYDAYTLHNFIETFGENLNQTAQLSESLSCEIKFFNIWEWEVKFLINDYVLNYFLEIRAYSQGNSNYDINIILTFPHKTYELFYNGSYFKIRKELFNGFKSILLHSTIKDF